MWWMKDWTPGIERLALRWQMWRVRFIWRKRRVYIHAWDIYAHMYLHVHIYLLTCFVQKIKYVLFHIKCTKHLGGRGDEGEKNKGCLHIRWIQAGRTETVWGARVLTPNCVQETQCLIQGQKGSSSGQFSRLQSGVLFIKGLSFVTASSFWAATNKSCHPLYHSLTALQTLGWSLCSQVWNTVAWHIMKQNFCISNNSKRAAWNNLEMLWQLRRAVFCVGVG